MATVKEVQTRLLALGYELPRFGADGYYGTETEAALKEFQSEKGLPQTGRIDFATEDALFGKAKPTSAANVVAKQPKASRAISEIVIHCAATPEGRDVSVDTIRQWHKDKGWKDIGYHYVVKLDGSIEAGRPEAQVGAHVEGHNTGTLGVVYVGGVAKDGKTAKDTRTPAQKAALIDLVKSLLTKYPSIKKVTGHNQYSSKACPSFDVQKDELGKLI